MNPGGWPFRLREHLYDTAGLLAANDDIKLTRSWIAYRDPVWSLATFHLVINKSCKFSAEYLAWLSVIHIVGDTSDLIEYLGAVRPPVRKAATDRMCKTFIPELPRLVVTYK